MARARKRPIPLTVVTGARGAGKTTLINRLLADPAFANTAVILNDFGATQLAAGVVSSSATDGYIALGAGCVCCAVRGALSDSLEAMLRDLDNGRVAAIGRVVIEADETADPAAIVLAIERHPYLSLRYAGDGIIAVVDGRTAEAVLASRADAVGQVAVADVVALTHGQNDIVAIINPLATVVDAATAPVSSFTGHGAFDPASGNLDAWLALPPAAIALTGEAARMRAFMIERQAPMPLAALDRFLDYLAALIGPRLIKVRGAVRGDDGSTVIVDGIGGSFRPPAIFEGRAGLGPRVRFLVVARDLDPAMFDGYLAAFLNEARADTPDREAIIANPLAIAGFSARRGR